MAVAILDTGGNRVYFEKMDGTQTGSVDAAIEKARSAVLFRRPTKVFQDSLAAGGEGLKFLRLTGAIPIDGGLPIIMDGKRSRPAGRPCRQGGCRFPEVVSSALCGAAKRARTARGSVHRGFSTWLTLRPAHHTPLLSPPHFTKRNTGMMRVVMNFQSPIPCERRWIEPGRRILQTPNL
jgi:hypothetical protein